MPEPVKPALLTSSIQPVKRPTDISQPPPGTQVKELEVAATASKPQAVAEPQRSADLPQQSSGNGDDAYDELTVDELISLLQNFSKLDKDSQEQLVLYMRKLESTHPDKVAFIKRQLQ